MPRLVLTRKLNEQVFISSEDKDLVTVSVIKIDKNQVRLSFEAEADIRILRAEKAELNNDK